MNDCDVLARLGPKAALSHHSAAREWGLELHDDDGSRHVTVARTRSRVTVSGVHVHRADLDAEDVELRGEVRVTSVLRTLCDLARILPLVAAVVCADSALRQGLLNARDLSARASAAWGRGSGRVRAMADLVDPKSGSVLETLLRVLLVTNGLTPTTQHVIRDRFGEFVGRVDFCWPQARLVVEADGYAFHADRESYRRDRDRLNRLEQLGWRVLRFSWEDVVGRPDHVLAMVRTFLDEAA